MAVLASKNVASVSSKGELAIVLTSEPYSEKPGTLARVPTSGGTPREIAEDVWCADWARDGESLVFMDTQSYEQIPFSEAQVGEAREFKNGRQFAAWLGLVPRQHSTGGKTRLGQITRSGDGYLRTLLVLGARAVLRRAPHERDPLSRWALALRERRGYHRACVAIAAKNARHVWAALAGRTPALSA